MRKITKALAAGACLAGAYIGLGEAMHYIFLSGYRGRKDISYSDITPEKLEGFRRNPESVQSYYEWYDLMQPEDKVIINSSNERIHADVIKAEKPSDVWVVSAHGYVNRPAQTAQWARYYYNRGFNLLAPHARAHDKSEHKYVTMGALDKNDYVDWINYITALNPDAKIILHGISMGAATVMLVTGEKLPKNVKCCVEDCGFTDCRAEFINALKQTAPIPAFPLIDIFNSTIKRKAGWSMDECSPLEAVKRSVTPTLFLHGDVDKFVPFFMQRELYEHAACKKDICVIHGAEHANSYDTNPRDYIAAVAAFVDKYI